MSLPNIAPKGHIDVPIELLTPNNFAPFGTAIAPPLPADLNTIPQSQPKSLHPQHQPQPQPANQNTALKTSPVSPLTNNYPSQPPSQGAVSIFSCFPRRNTYASASGKLRLKLSILERHPYTTQTFCPFSYAGPKASSGSTYFLVIVAPSLSTTINGVKNPPDLSKVRAFISACPCDGAQGAAVTYNPGTWHAPMIVLGERRLDFLVTQFVNGVAKDDCQEVLVGSGFVGGVKEEDVEIDLEWLQRQANFGLWRAKARL